MTSENVDNLIIACGWVVAVMVIAPALCYTIIKCVMIDADSRTNQSDDDSFDSDGGGIGL